MIPKQGRSTPIRIALIAETVVRSPAVRLVPLRLHSRDPCHIRQLKPRHRAEMKAVREKKGVEAAIKRARKLAHM